MPDRFAALRNKVTEIAEWSGTNIWAWAIFDSEGLALFFDNIGWEQSDNLEVTLSILIGKISEVIKDSEHYGLAFTAATFELETRDKLHYFRFSDFNLSVITEFKLRGEESFIKNLRASLDELREVL